MINCNEAIPKSNTESSVLYSAVDDFFHFTYVKEKSYCSIAIAILKFICNVFNTETIFIDKHCKHNKSQNNADLFLLIRLNFI